MQVVSYAIISGMQHEFEGLVLKAAAQGERDVLLTLFSPQHGKVRGFFKRGRKQAAALQPGSLLQVTWRRRLEHQLGTFQVEVLKAPASRYFDDFSRLQCLHYLAEILDGALMEGEPQPALFKRTQDFVDTLALPALWQRLGLYELKLLDDLGFGLSLDATVAVPCEKGAPLTYVSPKSGRAVSAEVGKPYADKLLPLPHLFGGPKKPESQDFLDVFKLTGHFLHQALPHKRLQARHELLNHARQTDFS